MVLCGTVLFLSSAPFAQASATVPQNVCPELTQTLVLGDTDKKTNGMVSVVQQFLAHIFSPPESMSVTGTFGPRTRALVMKFQSLSGIRKTGELGPATRATMHSLCLATAEKISSASQTSSPTTTSSPQDRVAALLPVLKAEKPFVYVIDNPELLKQQQTFFTTAEKGDVLLMYEKAKQAIVYSPSTKAIKSQGPIVGDVKDFMARFATSAAVPAAAAQNNTYCEATLTLSGVMYQKLQQAQLSMQQLLENIAAANAKPNETVLTDYLGNLNTTIAPQFSFVANANDMYSLFNNQSLINRGAAQLLINHLTGTGDALSTFTGRVLTLFQTRTLAQSGRKNQSDVQSAAQSADDARRSVFSSMRTVLQDAIDLEATIFADYTKNHCDVWESRVSDDVKSHATLNPTVSCDKLGISVPDQAACEMFRRIGDRAHALSALQQMLSAIPQ